MVITFLIIKDSLLLNGLFGSLLCYIDSASRSRRIVVGSGFDSKLQGIEKASGEPNKTKVAKVSRAKAQEIAKTKMEDLNAADLEAATRMIEGTARSMGIEITD